MSTLPSAALPESIPSATSASPLRYVVLLWFCVAAIVAYIQRTAISIAAPQIQESLALTPERMGWLMSAYYWAYALSQLPAGALGRHLGSRQMLVLSVGASSIFAGLVGFVPDSQSFILCWLLTGIAIAGIFPSCVQSITRWFPPNERALPSGALASAMSVGAGISLVVTPWLFLQLANFGQAPWRLVFILYGIPGVLWAMGFGIWFRDDPPSGPRFDDIPPENPEEDGEQDSGAEMDPERPSVVPSAAAPLDHPEWLLDYRTWLICAQQFFRAGGYIFFQTWFPSYLMSVHQVTLSSAGLLSSMPLLGVVLGGITGGIVCDWIENRTGSRKLARQGVGVVSHAICGLLIFAAQRVLDPQSAVLLISLGSFVFALGSSASYAINMDLAGSRSCTMFALMNMCGNIGAAISPIVVGYLVLSFGWSPVLPFFAGVYLSAALCWLLLVPRAESLRC